MLKNVGLLVASLARAWVALVGGIAGAVILAGGGRSSLLGTILPGAVAGLAVVRLALRHDLAGPALTRLMAHRLTVAYLAFGCALAVMGAL